MSAAGTILNPAGWLATKIGLSNKFGNTADIISDPAKHLYQTTSNAISGSALVAAPPPGPPPTPQDPATAAAMNAAAGAERNQKGRASTYLTRGGSGDANVFSRSLLAN